MENENIASERKKQTKRVYQIEVRENRENSVGKRERQRKKK